MKERNMTDPVTAAGSDGQQTPRLDIADDHDVVMEAADRLRRLGYDATALHVVDVFLGEKRDDEWTGETT